MSSNNSAGSSESDIFYNRRLRGTVVYRLRNYFSFGVLGISFICGLAFHYLPPTQKFHHKVMEGALNDNEETIGRKMMFREHLRTSADTLRKVMEDDMKPIP